MSRAPRPGAQPFDRDPTLALVIGTNGPAPLLRAVLEVMRPQVDEIVVGVDRTGDPLVVDACAGLADRVLSYELALPEGPRPLAALRHACTADWILQLDTDEVPGAATLATVREVIADRRPSAIALETRWLHPDAGHWITSPQWRWEMKRRIVRNTPGTWHHRGTHHTHVEADGELRLVDLPIYHLDLVLNHAATRRRKARERESRAPAAVAQGMPLNAMYLPEALGDRLTTAPVDPGDRELIDALLDARPFTPDDVTRPAVETLDWTALNQFNDRPGPMAEDEHRASLRLCDPVTRVPAAAVRRYMIAVTHEGRSRWAAGDRHEPLVRLGYRWIRAGTGATVVESRWLLSESVMPGETSLQLAWLQTPPEPGPHRLEVDLVHEHHRWFGCAVTLDVEVEAADVDALRAAGPAAADGAEAARLQAELDAVRAEAARLRATRRHRLAARLASR